MSYSNTAVGTITFSSEGSIGSRNNALDRSIIEDNHLANRGLNFIDGDSLSFSGNSLTIYTSKARINNILGDELCIYGDNILIEGGINLQGVLVLQNNISFIIKAKNNFTEHIIKDSVLSQGTNTLILDSSDAVNKISTFIYPNPDLQSNSFTLVFQGRNGNEWYGGIGSISANAPITQLNTADRQTVTINNGENIDHTSDHNHVLFVQNANFMASETIINSTTFYGAVDKLGIPISDATITIHPQAHLTVNSATTKAGAMNVLAGGATINSKNTMIDRLISNAGTIQFINSEININNLQLINAKLDIGLSSVTTKNLTATDSCLTVGIDIENKKLTHGQLIILNNINFSDLTQLNLVLNSNQRHISDGTIITIIDGVMLKPGGFGLNISSDLPFSEVQAILTHNKLKLQINNSTKKLQQLVNLASKVSKDSGAAINILTEQIDEYPQALAILRQLQQAKDEVEARNILINFTDSTETTAAIEKVVETSFVHHSFETILNHTKLIDKDLSQTYLWNKLIIASTSQDTNFQHIGYQDTIKGAILGVTHNISKNLSLGLALNLNKNDFHNNEPKLGDTLLINNHTFYLYSNYYLTDKFWISSVINYGKNKVHSRRIRMNLPSTREVANGDYSASAFGIGAKISYACMLDDIYSFNTSLGIGYVDAHNGSYTESGTKDWNFDVGKKRKVKTTLVLGMSLIGNYEFFRPEIHFNGYQLINSQESVLKYRFTWMPEESYFTNSKSNISNRQYNLGIGLNIQLDPLQIKLGSDLRFTDHYQEYQHTIMCQLEI